MVDPDISRASLVLKIVTKHKHIANLQTLLKAFNDIVDFRYKLKKNTYRSSHVENSLEINNIIDRIASQRVLLASFESELQIIDGKFI